MNQLADDFRYACRRLRQTPSFTAIATLTLALGIGANTAVFSVIDPLLLRRLPVQQPDQLVLLHSKGPQQTIDISERGAFEAYAAERQVLSGAIADAGLFEFETTDGDRQAVATGEIVSANFFDVLGVSPRAGRLFSPDDDRAGNPVIVLSSAYWTRAFGADESAIGRTLRVNGQPQTIVGIAPSGFFGITVGLAPDFYVPLGSNLHAPGWVKIVARLRPGVSPSQAGATLGPVFEQIVAASTLPDVTKRQGMTDLLVTPAGRGLSDLRDWFGSRAWVLFGTVALVLLVASANVANLMLTRAAGRRHEVVVQIALGATSVRIARQFIAEGVVVAVLGGIVGGVAALWTSRALVAGLSIGRRPVALDTGLDARVLVFSAAILCLTVLLCAVLPAFTSRRGSLALGLKSRGTGFERGTRTSSVARALIVAQIAASVTLVSGSGLLLHSLVNLYSSDVGFNPDRVLTVSLTDTLRNRPDGQADGVLSELIEQVRRLPGAEAAALANLPPLAGREIGINVVAEGSSRQPDVPTPAQFASVTPGYFAALGLRVVSGRECSIEDTPTSSPAVIVNQRLAQHLFGQANPVAQQLRFVEGRRPPMVVVGVAADAVYSNVREEPRNFLYLCSQQRRSTTTSGVLFVRSTEGSADRLAPTVQRLVQSMDRGVGIASIKTLGGYLSESLYGDRLAVSLLSGFSLLALVIAAVGLYGLLAGIVGRQTPEIGLRVALGASPWQTARFVAAPAAILTAAGLAVGSLGAFLTSSMLSTLLFGVGTTDPLTLVGVTVTLAVTATVACYGPLRRALRINPVAALRGE